MSDVLKKDLAWLWDLGTIIDASKTWIKSSNKENLKTKLTNSILCTPKFQNKSSSLFVSYFIVT